MQAKDVMTTRVVTVPPSTSVRDIAKLLLERGISAVPVVDLNDRLLGIVSEGDLIRRPETGTARHPSWWLSLLSSPEDEALAYIKSHGGHARDVMTREVVTVKEDAPLEQVAEALEKHGIKRLPVLRDGRLVGIVSRADLLRGLVARQAGQTPSTSDLVIKTSVEAAVAEASVRDTFLSIVVSGGKVHLWGAVESDAEKRAAQVAAEGVPGVKGVRNDINVLPPGVRTVMWAE